jgi:hypothetical protein
MSLRDLYRIGAAVHHNVELVYPDDGTIEDLTDSVDSARVAYSDRRRVIDGTRSVADFVTGNRNGWAGYRQAGVLGENAPPRPKKQKSLLAEVGPAIALTVGIPFVLWLHDKKR